MDLLFCSKRNLAQFMCFWVWLCFVLLGSSLTASQPTGLKWRTQPTPQTVEAGSSVSFTCSADYSKKIQLYEWERNNLRLPRDDRYTVKNDGQTLEISQTKFEDRGDYRCVAKRKGKVLGRSQNAALNVNVRPTFDVRPKNTTAFVNDNLWLHCNATGNPKPQITWGRYDQGGDRLDKSRFILHPNGTLHIKRVRLEDQGGYFCIAANHAEMKLTKFSLVVKRSPLSTSQSTGLKRLTARKGKVFGRSQNAALNVKVRPAFDVRPKNTTAFVNDNLWLHCNATGNPKPKICWGRYDQGGDRLDRSRFIPYHNGTLHIKRVRLEDQGSYFCIAANRADMKLAKFTLVVKESKDEELLD